VDQIADQGDERSPGRTATRNFSPPSGPAVNHRRRTHQAFVRAHNQLKAPKGPFTMLRTVEACREALCGLPGVGFRGRIST
jgi:hypothetical protein